jgi:hypothetical protein
MAPLGSAPSETEMFLAKKEAVMSPGRLRPERSFEPP